MFTNKRTQAAILRGNIEETEQQKQEEEHIAKSLKQNVEKLSKVENLENLRVLYRSNSYLLQIYKISDSSPSLLM